VEHKALTQSINLKQLEEGDSGGNRLTHVHLEKRPINGSSGGSGSVKHKHRTFDVSETNYKKMRRSGYYANYDY